VLDGCRTSNHAEEDISKKFMTHVRVVHCQDLPNETAIREDPPLVLTKESEEKEVHVPPPSKMSSFSSPICVTQVLGRHDHLLLEPPHTPQAYVDKKVMIPKPLVEAPKSATGGPMALDEIQDLFSLADEEEVKKLKPLMESRPKLARGRQFKSLSSALEDFDVSDTYPDPISLIDEGEKSVTLEEPASSRKKYAGRRRSTTAIVYPTASSRRKGEERTKQSSRLGSAGEVETSKHVSSERESKSEEFTSKTTKPLCKFRSRRVSISMDGSINIGSIEKDPVLVEESIQEVENLLATISGQRSPRSPRKGRRTSIASEERLTPNKAFGRRQNQRLSLQFPNEKAGSLGSLNIHYS
jgi:hypothetical protein